MGEAGEHVDGLGLVAGHFEVPDFVGVDPPFLDQGFAAHDDEELPFRVVPVLAFRDAGVRHIDAELSMAGGLEEFGEGAAGIHVHLEREGDAFFREIAQVGAIQFLGETARGDFGHQERLGLLVECREQVNDIAERGAMRSRDIAVAAVFHREDTQSVEFAAMLFAFEAADHLIYQVVDVE